MSDGEKPLEPRWLWYVLSFIIPLLGIILGVTYLGNPEPENKRFGKNCIFFGAVSYVVALGCAVLFIILFLGLMTIFLGLMTMASPTLR